MMIISLIIFSCISFYILTKIAKTAKRKTRKYIYSVGLTVIIAGFLTNLFGILL